MAPPAAGNGASVEVGRISGVFGVKGWVRVFSYTDPPGNILRYGPWRVGGSEGKSYEIAEGATHGKGVVARLAGIDDRDGARALIGAGIWVPRGRFGAAGEGSYYWSDLVGLQVWNASGEALGRVEELLETGANDVLVVAGERRRLIPFVPGTIVQEVDLQAGKLVVNWDADF